MKKIMLLCTILCASIFSFSQEQMMTDSEITTVINESGELNPWLKNPNLIHKGEYLQYGMENQFGVRFDTAVQVLYDGESQWTIIKYRLAGAIIKHGKVVSLKPVPNDDVNKSGASTPGTTDESESKFDSGFWFPLLGILALIISLLAFYRYKRKQKKEVRSAQESKARERVLAPLVAEGITDAQAPSYMQSVARRKNYTITGPTESILLTTVRPIRMDYQNGETNMESFTNEPFYRAPARRNEDNVPCFAYFRQRCGNDGTCLDESDIIVTLIAQQSMEIRQANRAVSTPMQGVATISETKESRFLKLAKLADECISAGDDVTFVRKNGETRFIAKENKINLNGNHVPEVKEAAPSLS